MSKFSNKEIELIKKRFNAIAKKGEINYQQFKESMGILGLDHATFLLDRIFYIISDGKNAFTLNQYIQYLELAMFGDNMQKAKLSFSFIDLHKNGYIEYRQFEKMMLDLTMFWNQLTGSRVTPRQVYISNLWDQFQCDRLTFDLFFNKYEEIQASVDWYEYFNGQEVLKQRQPTVHKGLVIYNMIDQFQGEIRNCVNLLSDYEKLKKNDDSYVQGPCNFSTSQIAKDGDEDPSFEISFLSNIKSTSISLLNTNDHPLDQIEQRIQYLLQITEQAQNLRIVQQRQSFRSTNRQSLNRQRATIQRMPKRKAKQQLSVYFGHENWNLIVNLMIGMRKAVSSIQPEFYGQRVLKNEFNDRYLYEILQQRTNNFDFRKAFLFKDYAPSIFLRIRREYQINNSDYLRSIGPENLLGNLVFGKLNSLTELGSTGKSGSFFYYTQDCQYMIKTISEDEAQLLRKILPKYFHHMITHSNTLISRIFGFHQMKIQKSKNEYTKIYLVTMVNIFRAGVDIDFQYDIKGTISINKGSLYGRQAQNNENLAIKTPKMPLKDLDLLSKKDYINLEPQDRMQFIQVIKEDSQFLKDNDIIDYSLLIGFHKRNQNRLSQYGQYIANSRTFWESFEGGILSFDREWIYYIGIIDILTLYNTKKVLEYGFKSTLISNDISCIPPNKYAERFVSFITSHLLKPTYMQN